MEKQPAFDPEGERPVPELTVVEDLQSTEDQVSEGNARALGKLADMLTRQQVDVGEIDDFREARYSTWQVVTNSDQLDEQGNPVVGKDGKPIKVAKTHDLEGMSVAYKPKTAKKDNEGVDVPSLFVTQAPPLIIKPGRRVSKPFKEKTTFIVPDIQAGYQRIDDKLVPMQDESAMDVVRQLIRHTQPDEIVVLGDNVDLPSFSRFDPSPSFVQTTQASIDRFQLELGRYRADSPDSHIVVLEGNHDERLMKFIRKNAAELAGLRRANMPKEMAVLSLAYLLRTEELEIEYLPGYPANKYWINDRLKAIHGDIVRSSGSTAAAYAMKHDTSTVFGHTHRIESHQRTTDTGRIVSAHSFGTLARVDGNVPSYHSGLGHHERPLKTFENWQNGAGLVHSMSSGPFQIETLLIHSQEDYVTMYDGRVFTPRTELKIVKEAA